MERTEKISTRRNWSNGETELVRNVHQGWSRALRESDRCRRSPSVSSLLRVDSLRDRTTMSELPSQFMPSPLYACIRMPHAPELALDVAKDFSPRLQRYASGCVVLDVSGLGCLLGEPDVIGVEIERACAARWAERDRRPALVHVAVAPTQIAALLLACGPGRRPAHGRHRRRRVGAVGRAPVDPASGADVGAWRHPAPASSGSAAERGRPASRGVRCHQRAFDVLRRWGLTTVGELAALPAGDLSARLGQARRRAAALARGVDRAAARAGSRSAAVSRSACELEWPIDALEPLSFVLARMLDPLSAALERADRGAAAIHLRSAARRSHRARAHAAAAGGDARSDASCGRCCCSISNRIRPRRPSTSSRSRSIRRPAASPVFAARARAAVGGNAGDADRPPRRAGRRVALRRADAARYAPAGRVRDAALCPRCAASNRHSAIDDGRAALRSRHAAIGTRVCAASGRRVAVRVTVERGRPARVAIDRRGMPGGGVEQCAGPWRSSGAWWDRGPPLESRRMGRRAQRRLVCRLFRDRDTGHWFMEGVLD